MAELVIAALSGILAGLGTGFAGLSAAVFIAPMLTAFLGVDTFSAVGIALASDVLASAASAFTYHRHGNTALRENRLLMITVLVFAILGSVAAHVFTGLQLGESLMSWWLIAATLVLGIKLLFFPAQNDGRNHSFSSGGRRVLMLLCGIYIGFVCGFQGTGGGLMLLFVLNILLDNPFKKSVGTSVCIMTFAALIGTVSHFSLRGLPDERLLPVCVACTLLGAGLASRVANRVPPVVLKRITGGLMSASGVAMVLARLL